MLNYEYYNNTYKGTSIPSTSFDYFAGQATDFINSVVNAALPITDAVNKCTCKLAELLYDDSKAKYSSRSVGNVSENYAILPDLHARMYSQMQIYLGKTGLLYRGL
jgi:hypothetical protein